MSSKREESKHLHPKIKVVGVGGAGGNAVKWMIESGLTDVEFYAVNTVKEALDKHNDATPVLIGANTTPGYSGADPEMGKRAAEEDREKLHNVVADADIVFIIAGMGGGTGAGAAPLIASLVREQRTLAVGVVTLPFDFEGQRRAEKAEQGLQELREKADSVHVVPNQRLLALIEDKQKLKIREAFHLSDEMLLRGVESISKFYASTARN